MAWQVRLIKKPRNIGNYPPNYFPRKFAYKKEAMDLAHYIKSQGGVAIAEKCKNINDGSISSQAVSIARKDSLSTAEARNFLRGVTDDRRS